MRGYAIGELAQRSGVRAANIRYYEEIGVMPKPSRRASGHRSYGRSDLERLVLVKSFRELGFSLAQVRALMLLSVSAGRSCVEARDLASGQLGVVRRRLNQLRKLERALEGRVAECNVTCLDGPAPDCSIFKLPLASLPGKAPPRCCS